MLERFTEPARAAVTQARAEAVSLRQGRIGCEHLLLALASNRETTAGQTLAAFGLHHDALRGQVMALAGEAVLDANALATLGIDLDVVRAAAEASFGPGALSERRRKRDPGRPSFSRPAKKSLELALRSAVNRHDHEIGTGHLLLGLLNQKDNGALRVLAAAGVHPNTLRIALTGRMADAA